MPRRKLDLDAPFQTITGAARITGLAQGFIRDGCKNNAIPHIRCGQEYRVNMPLWMERLNAESAKGRQVHESG